MENHLVKLLVIAALLQFGIQLNDVTGCIFNTCRTKPNVHLSKILRINWRPISVFPEQAKRFR